MKYIIIKKSIKCLCLCLIVLFVYGQFKIVEASSIEITDDFVEEKIMCNANINEEFDDKSVMVVMKHSQSQYYGVSPSFEEKIFSVEDVLSYEDLSELSVDSLTNKGIDSSAYPDILERLNSIDFKQILKINLNTDTKQEVLDVIKEIESFDEVLSVGPNYIYKVSDASTEDTYFYNQWALNGENGIDVSGAWEFVTGSREVRVGVIDSGIASHSDLNSNVTSGKDFFNEDYVTTDDESGHGTSVAGIIGAIGNNGKGVAGINHNITLVPLQTTYDGVHSKKSVLVKAINYARDLWNQENRISILNYSIGGFGHFDENVTPDKDVLAAVEAFPGLFVWAAGNEGENLDTLEGVENFSLNNIISVGAHDKENKRSEWNTEESSSYGHAVDIYAPGSSCFTTYLYDGYSDFEGTSCAAPHVTGVAALLLSIKPDLTPLQLKNAIVNSAETIPMEMPNDIIQNVKKLNAFNAVKYVLSNYSQSTQLKYNTKTLNKSINSTSGYFEEDNFFLRLNVENYYEYEFEISSSNILEVTLYDSEFNNLNVITSNEVYTKQFSQLLFEDEYYLKVNFVDENANGTITVSIIGHTHSYTYEQTPSGHIATCECGDIMTSSHAYDAHNCIYCGAYTEMHDYDKNYVWIDYNYHRAQCECGEIDTQPHAISSSAYSNNLKFAICLLCGGRVEKGFVIINANSTLVNKVTINGSFILPNGVIVLEDEDLEAYLNGTLVFCDKNEIPVIK